MRDGVRAAQHITVTVCCSIIPVIPAKTHAFQLPGEEKEGGRVPGIPECQVTNTQKGREGITRTNKRGGGVKVYKAFDPCFYTPVL